MRRKDMGLYGLIAFLVAVILVLVVLRGGDVSPVKPGDDDPRQVDVEKRQGGPQADHKKEPRSDGLVNGDDAGNIVADIRGHIGKLVRDLPIPKKISATEARVLIKKVFEIARDAAQSGDDMGQQMLQLSVEDERQLGAVLHDELVKNRQILREEALQRRIETLASPLLKLRKRTAVSYTFTIIDSDEINASSCWGGYVYVNKGLIEFARSDAELQFVLGHEIAHVDLRHCAKKLTYPATVAKLGAGAVGSDLTPHYS